MKAKKNSARRRTSHSGILQIALELFSVKGYSETKMTDIARDAGLSVGALYLRFRNKQDICLELIKDQTRDYELRASLVVDSGSEPAQKLRDYIIFCMEYALKKKQLISMLYREHRLHFLKPLRTRFMKHQRELIETILIDGIKQRKMRNMDTESAALMIFGSIRGAVMLKLMFGTGSASSLSESLFDLISNGIRKDTR